MVFSPLSIRNRVFVAKIIRKIIFHEKPGFSIDDWLRKSSEKSFSVKNSVAETGLISDD
jgi:hypothetical protein